MERIRRPGADRAAIKEFLWRFFVEEYALLNPGLDFTAGWSSPLICLAPQPDRAKLMKVVADFAEFFPDPESSIFNEYVADFLRGVFSLFSAVNPELVKRNEAMAEIRACLLRARRELTRAREIARAQVPDVLREVILPLEMAWEDAASRRGSLLKPKEVRNRLEGVLREGFLCLYRVLDNPAVMESLKIEELAKGSFESRGGRKSRSGKKATPARLVTNLLSAAGVRRQEKTIRKFLSQVR